MIQHSVFDVVGLWLDYNNKNSEIYPFFLVSFFFGENYIVAS